MSCGARAAVCRRANASRFRTIRAARSDSSAMRRRSRASAAVGRTAASGRRRPQLVLRELGVADHAGQRVVQLVRDARDELPDRRELFGLQQLRLRRLQPIDGRDQPRVRAGELLAHPAEPACVADLEVTFFAICTTAAPSATPTTGHVVTLKIRSSGSVTSACSHVVAAWPTAHSG